MPKVNNTIVAMLFKNSSFRIVESFFIGNTSMTISYSKGKFLQQKDNHILLLQIGGL